MSERTIRAAIATGASTPEEIGEKCGAGTECFGCWPALHELLDEAALRAASAAQESATSAA